jgi:hypothetical protein
LCTLTQTKHYAEYALFDDILALHAM